MDNHQRTLRFSAALIAAALLFRLSGTGLVHSLTDFLTQPNIASFLLYLETGRIVRFSQSSGQDLFFALESATPDFAREKPHFTADDAETIAIRYNCNRDPDLGELITRPLDWDLTSGEPTVLILHTHTTESYTKSPGESYRETSAYRTLDENFNMISVGDRLTQALQAAGITVLHDRQLHDYPSYNGSYNHARAAIKEYLDAYPSIRLVLDLHRDASGDNGNQMQTHATVDGQESAQLMLVVGTDASGLSHGNWQENLALGLKLHSTLEKINPGIMRYVNLRGQRFNQDLSTGMLLVEVGAAGDSHNDALTAADVLARGIIALANGTQ